MTIHECPREQEVVDTLATGQWPERADADLRRHVAGCPVCDDLVAVLDPLAAAWSETRADVHVPAPGTVWWRAQMRARQEAARAATRPVIVAQAVGGLAALIACVLGMVVFLPSFVTVLGSSWAHLGPGLARVGTMSQGWVLVAIVAVIAATSLALYLAVAED